MRYGKQRYLLSFIFILKSLLLGSLMSFIFSATASAMTVVIDPGHGGYGTSHAGAIYMPYYEKELNFEVASQVRDELSDAGIDVYMTREGDEPLSLEERADLASDMGADLLISIHFNSSAFHDKNGSEIWTSLYEPYGDEGRELGELILEELGSLGFENKGVKVKSGDSGDYYGIIRHSAAHGIPAIIVEHCFIDSYIDRAILDYVGTSALAHADATGIISYIESIGGITSQEHPAELSTAHSVEEASPSVSHSVNQSRTLF